MDRELSLEELETEHATELPERDTLTTFNISNIFQGQIVKATNFWTYNSLALAVGSQSINVWQNAN